MVKRRDKRRNKTITARDIADKFNITYQSVNHYTDFGLLPVLTKEGNVRLYSKNIVAKRLKKIRELMNEGYSLRLIRKRLLGI